MRQSQQPVCTLALLFGIAGSLACGLHPASAAKKATGRSPTTVTACSTSGHHGCYTAPVRMTALGPQMRLKGGTWIWCEESCQDTLRRATIDFWDDQSERGGGN